MMKKALVLAVGLGLASFGFGAETAPAGAVVGWWKFDDATNRGLDSSDYHNDLDGLSDVTPVAADTGYTTRGTYDDSGCFYIGTVGKTATATPEAQTAYRRCFKVVSSTEVVGKPGSYTIASSAAVGFEADTEGDRVQAVRQLHPVKAKKPDDVESACFFRVFVNAADKL